MSAKKFVVLPVLGCLAAALAFTSEAPTAQGGLLWQTTFDCLEWNQKLGGADAQVCADGDGVVGYGNWTTANGTVDQITSAANNPAGAGGRGFRHWRGPGTSNNGGGIKISFPTQNEIWVRWYMRYESGFAWAIPGQPQQSKDLYFNVSDNSGTVPVFTTGFHDTNHYGISMVQPRSINLYTSSMKGWVQVMGGLVGDGNWHMYETHVKMPTGGAVNGIGETWVDGQLVHRQTDVPWGNTGNWSYVLVGSNASAVANGPDRYTDYDDFAISTTGYIGPINSVNSVLPAPQNLRIITSSN